MAKTKLYNEEAAFRVMNAMIMQARLDITRPIARPEDRLRPMMYSDR